MARPSRPPARLPRVRHGCVVVAVWREDTSPEIAGALAGECATFLALTGHLDADERGRLLEESLGGAWAPRSDEELHMLTHALMPDADA